MNGARFKNARELDDYIFEHLKDDTEQAIRLLREYHRAQPQWGAGYGAHERSLKYAEPRRERHTW